MLGSAPHFDNAAAAEERHTTITMVWLPGFPVAVRSWYDPAMPARRGRDNTAMLWVEEGETRVGPVATVAPVAPIDKEYTFAIPNDLADRVQAGQRVVVPLGRAGRLMTAFCLRIEQGEWSSSLKPIDSLVDQVSFLPGKLLELGRWMARHYACPLGRTLGALVPAAVHKRSGFRTVRHARLLVPLEQIADGQSRLGPRQRRLLEELSAAPAPLEVDDLLARSGASAATLRQAVQRGWIEMATERVAAPAPDFDLLPAEPDFELNAEQQAALQTITATIGEDRFRVDLLFGVSGSGKTEVYIRAMRRVLDQGRQAILLVPEIALTTQLLNRLACRFTDVAVIHSGLSDVQRSLTWTAIAAGTKRVVIGTRSAVFAPCPNLGLIVVDEEQETSYKNLQSPRFLVRDVAVKRGQIENVPVVLGSATPSLESWVNCDRAPHYRRIEISKRVRNLPMPEVQVVDMREERQVLGRPAVLSRLMDQQLADALARDEQGVVLINRRGFASWLFCPGCKRRIECPRCNVSMVYHSALNVVICHHCSRREPAPTECPDPSCGQGLAHAGSGTQRVEQHLRRRFPDKQIVRVDSDTMRHARTYRKVIDDFENRRVDVLVGTQMVAKGLDFPHVSFVGVIGGDAAAAAGDFRAGERLFQLITQVAGRAGRDNVKGSVVVQTVNPDSPALRAAIRHDYRAFVEPEVEVRRRYGYPPFSRLARVVLAHPREGHVRAEADALTGRIREAITALGLTRADVLGPNPCVLSRLRGQYRYDVLARAATASDLQTLLDRLRADGAFKTKAKSLIIDVDPVSLA